MQWWVRNMSGLVGCGVGLWAMMAWSIGQRGAKADDVHVGERSVGNIWGNVNVKENVNSENVNFSRLNVSALILKN